MSVENLATTVVVPEASGAITMADAVIRLLEGHIGAVSNLAAEEALKKIKKEVNVLKKHAVKGDINGIATSWQFK